MVALAVVNNRQQSANVNPTSNHHAGHTSTSLGAVYPVFWLVGGRRAGTEQDASSKISEFNDVSRQAEVALRQRGEWFRSLHVLRHAIPRGSGFRDIVGSVILSLHHFFAGAETPVQPALDVFRACGGISVPFRAGAGGGGGGGACCCCAAPRAWERSEASRQDKTARQFSFRQM